MDECECDPFAPVNKERRDTLLHYEQTIFSSQDLWKAAWSRFASRPLVLAALSLVISIILIAILAPMLSTFPYDQGDLSLKNLPPNSQFWFGTDEMGRDLFVRCWWGARISLFIGIAATFIDGCIGILYGAFAAFKGGWIEEGMMRAADVLYTIPYLLIVILLIVTFGSGITTILIALTLTGWITMARIVRNQILQVKHLEFVEAAYALGASNSRILFHHLIPNALGSIITTATFTIPTAIFTEAFLSFLGLGVQSPIASWGALAYDGLAALRFYPWRLFIPAILISMTILSFNVIGDALRDHFDQRLR